jgi:hypothetical protein
MVPSISGCIRLTLLKKSLLFRFQQPVNFLGKLQKPLRVLLNGSLCAQFLPMFARLALHKNKYLVSGYIPQKYAVTYGQNVRQTWLSSAPVGWMGDAIVCHRLPKTRYMKNWKVVHRLPSISTALRPSPAGRSQTPLLARMYGGVPKSAGFSSFKARHSLVKA